MRWYHAARSRWRGIEWPLARFRRHLRDERPRHPEDLFLGGAAGERLPEAWSSVHEECRSPVVERLHGSPRGGLSSEDLWSEAMVKLMGECLESDPLPDGRRPAKIIRFRGRSTLGTFLYVTALRVGTDAHRRRQARPAVESLESGAEVGSNEPSVEIERVSAEALDEEARRFTEAILGLTAERRALLALVHGRGIARGTAGRLLGLPPYQVTRELKRAVAEIRDRLRLSGDERWTSDRIDAWLRAWTIAAAGILEEATDDGR